MLEHDSSSGKYLYCIIRCAEPRQFAARGIGEEGAAVHTIVAGDLAAVVSDSPVIEYDSSRRNMMAHTKVLEEVMQEFTILPVRFGIIAPSADVIREQLLGRRAGEIADLLGRLDGRQEVGLKAFWFEDVAFQEIIAEHAPIRALRDRLAGRSPEQTYYERIKLGEMIEQAITRKRAADAATILARLRPRAQDLRTNTILTDRMVLNAAFLIDRADGPLFEQAIQELDLEMGQRLVFKFVSSAPPYNFVDLLMRWEG